MSFSAPQADPGDALMRLQVGLRDMGFIVGSSSRYSPEHREMCRYYIDAYQSMRKTIFGELLPQPVPAA